MLGLRLFALGIACLPAGISLAACTDAASPGSPDGSAPALLLPQRELTAPAAPGVLFRAAEEGGILAPPGTALAPDAGAPAPLGDAGADVTEEGGAKTMDAGGTAPPEPVPSNDIEGVGESNFPTPITPSAGCAEQNPAPPQGVAFLTIRDAAAEYLVTLPEGYDGTTPLPLIFGFHGRARTFRDFAEVDATLIQSELGSRAIMVYPQAQGGEGWTNELELPPSLEFWNELYRRMLAQYCVDTTHVFAVGHSSGGFFSNVLACRHGERLRGIGVVAGTLPESNCSGYVAAILIHGVSDTVVVPPRGELARDYWLTRNGCTPDIEPGSDSHCVDYQGCEPGLPVAWCEHDEPTYEDTNHGWPTFASHAIAEFLFSLP
jgi:poly(3-hydroxybutyrate) depolymerase